MTKAKYIKRLKKMLNKASTYTGTDKKKIYCPTPASWHYFISDIDDDNCKICQKFFGLEYMPPYSIASGHVCYNEDNFCPCIRLGFEGAVERAKMKILEDKYKYNYLWKNPNKKSEGAQ